MAPVPDWIQTLSASSFLTKIEGLNSSQRSQLLALRFACDPEFFARVVLPSHCRLRFAPMHRRLFRWHGEMGIGRPPGRRGLRFALAAPRGSAKSTVVSLVLTLHDILFERERYILLLSATEAQARQRLKALRRELEDGSVSRWSIIASQERRFTTRALQFGNVQVEAYGAGTEIRGINFEGFRPTKIILDDAEASRAATSARSRMRLREWFSEIVEYSGDTYTHLLAIGTVLHDKGLIADLLRRPDFTGHRARSIIGFSDNDLLWSEWRRRLLDFGDERRRITAREFYEAHRDEMDRGAEVLWPEKEDYEDLMSQLTLQGRRAFFQEKQNQPLGPEDALFDGESALRAQWLGSELQVGVLRNGAFIPVRRYADASGTGRRFGYLDAALGKGGRSGRGDFAALAEVVLLPDGSLVVDRLTARRLSPTEQVTRLFDAHERAAFERVAVEGTGFQELLLLPIEEERKRRQRSTRRADIPIETVHPKKSKLARIAALEPLISNGTIALGEGLDEEFWEELGTFPNTAHDDALDALAGAVTLARQVGPGGNDWKATRPRQARSANRF